MGEQGDIMVLTALCMTLLFGALALAIDVGQLYATKRQLQTLADAASMAGAMEIVSCGGAPNCAVLRNAATSALTENGASGFATVTQCGTTSATTMVLTVNNGPCKLGTRDPNHNDIGFVEAVVSKPVNTFFAGILGVPKVTVTARSEAGGAKPDYCVILLDPHANQALTMNGGGNMQASSCGVMVNSDSRTAAVFNGGVIVNSKVLNIHGGDLNNGNNSLTPSPTMGVAVAPDPLSNLPKPTIGSCGSGSGHEYSGSPYNVSLSDKVTNVFHPGVYCGGINFNAGAIATFTPGTYIFKGTMNVNAGSYITGTGVTFYFDSGSLQMNGGSHADLTAPSTGTYAGILYYQNPSDTDPVKLDGDSTSKWQGFFYAPTAALYLNGGSNLAAYTGIIAGTLMDNSMFTLGSDYSSLPGGNPLGTSSKTYLME